MKMQLLRYVGYFKLRQAYEINGKLLSIFFFCGAAAQHGPWPPRA